MLVLTRLQEQSVEVDGKCTVKILDVRGNRVKLGFIADQSTKVMRTEVVEMKDDDK